MHSLNLSAHCGTQSPPPARSRPASSLSNFPSLTIPPTVAGVALRGLPQLQSRHSQSCGSREATHDRLGEANLTCRYRHVRCRCCRDAEEDDAHEVLRRLVDSTRFHDL